MKMFAVKHKHQELFLPVVKGSNSKAELTDPMEQSPRLFKSYKGAAQAMYAWARGIHHGVGRWESSDCEYGSGGSYFDLEKIDITPQRHRHLEDVHVVEITMYVQEVTRGWS